MRVFVGPLNINRGRLSVVEAMKVPVETIRMLIKAESAQRGCNIVVEAVKDGGRYSFSLFFYLLGNLALCATFLNLARHRMEEL